MNYLCYIRQIRFQSKYITRDSVYFIIIKGWGGRWEGGSGLGAHVHLWLIHVNVWQNQYSIVKQNKVKIKIKKISQKLKKNKRVN